MPAADYVAGALWFATMLASALGAAWLVLARRYARLAGAPRVVAYGLLAVLAVLAIHLLPLVLGLLSQATVLAASLLLLGAAALVPRARGPAGPGAEVGPMAPVPGGERVAGVLAAIALGALALLVLAIGSDGLSVAPSAVDTLNFHLPGVARWLDSGSLWQIDVLLPYVAPGHYPNNGDILLLAAVLPWSNDFLSHFALWPVYLLTGAATYALAGELRAPRPAAISAACLVLALPAVLLPALVNSYPDALMLFGFAAGILFLVRHHHSGATAELVLAGLALGVSFGTKWYAVPAVAIVVVAWLLAAAVDGRAPRGLLRQGAAVVGLIALGGGIWFVRNWVESGNPVFPVRVAPFGIEIFDAPRDLIRERAGFTIADYLGDVDTWRDYILPQLRDALAFAGAVLLGGLLLAAVAAGSFARRAPGAGLAKLGVAVSAVLLVVYAVTPYSAGGAEGAPTIVGADARYVVPALIVAAPLCAWVAARLRHGSAVLASLSLLAVLDSVLQVSDEAVSLVTVGAGNWLAAVLVAALGVAAVWTVRIVRERLGQGRWRVAIAVSAVASLAALAAAGYAVQKRFNGVRYQGQDPTIDFVLTRAGEGQRVGLAGVWDADLPPVLPAFGPRLENEVAYVGPEVEGFLRRYPSEDAFVSAVDRGGYDYLFVGRGIPGGESLREEGWARAAGFEEVARSEDLTLLRGPGAVSPGAG